jgi:hypothetical protein
VSEWVGEREGEKWREMKGGDHFERWEGNEKMTAEWQAYFFHMAV